MLDTPLLHQPQQQQPAVVVTNGNAKVQSAEEEAADSLLMMESSATKRNNFWTNSRIWTVNAAANGAGSHSPSPQLALPQGDSSPSLSPPSSAAGDGQSTSSAGELSAGGHQQLSAQSSSASSSNATSRLSEDAEKNLRSFLRAIEQCRLARPISAEEKCRVLSWLGTSEEAEALPQQQQNEDDDNWPGDVLGLPPSPHSSAAFVGDQQPQPHIPEPPNWPRATAARQAAELSRHGLTAARQSLPPSVSSSKIRRKSDPAFLWRHANGGPSNSKVVGGTAAMPGPNCAQMGDSSAAEQLIRKWSTKSNTSSGAVEQLRTLRDQLGGGGSNKSAGNVAKGRSSWSASSSNSRPQLPFLVQQSDSAIGSSGAPSLGGSFSFLPPPPPYRPRQSTTSGSDGAIGTAQQQRAGGMPPRGTDFTSLLGFNMVNLPSQQQQGSNSGEEKHSKGAREAPLIRVPQTEEGKSTTTATTAPMTATMTTKATAGQRKSVGQIGAFWASSQRSSQSPSPSAMSCSGGGGDFPELQERMQRLQVSRENLSLQVAVLSQQVALQRKKIRDLEALLEHRRNAREESLPGAVQELAELQNKYLALEREKLTAERRLKHSNSELERLSEQPQPHSQPQPQQNGNGQQHQQASSRGELKRLQMAVQKLMADNEQKDSLIHSLRAALDEERRQMMMTANGSSSLEESFSPQPLDINEQIRRILLEGDDENDGNGLGPAGQAMMMAHSSSYPLALCSGRSLASSSSNGLPPPPAGTPPMRQQFMPVSNSFSSALAHQQAFAPPPPLWRASPPAIPPHMGQSPRTPASPLARQLAAELDELRRTGIQQNFHAQQHQQHQHQPVPAYSSASLPRSIHSKSNSLGAAPNHAIAGNFGESMKKEEKEKEEDEEEERPWEWVRRKLGGTQRSKANKARRSRSTPNLGPAEDGNGEQRQQSDDETASRVSSAARPPVNGGSKSFKRGRRARSTLRSFLDRFAHRGNSLQDLRPSPRQSPALSAGGPICLQPPIRQFVDWDQSKCARWLAELGFVDCTPGAVRSGRHLLNMENAQLERDLGLRSALQRKRLRTRLARMERGNDFEPADRLDTNQVMLWLDLIGLPQHRDLFAECRMDGHLLLALAAQDLLELGIHSALNHASLARGIQFLRSAEFHLHRLERHFRPESLSHAPVLAEVESWSHGCTLEWLCSVDLAEFTPNLVFSGLHGALIVLEPTFTAESLAEMLQIPVQKTLLRRHLTTQFNTLLGPQVVSHKRDVLAQPFVTHLTPSLRIRLAKKGFSLTRKKSRSDIFVEPEVRVCPAEANGGEEMSDV